MPVVNIDSSGVVGIVGIVATVATFFGTRLFDRQMFARRVEAERLTARTQHERDLMRDRHRMKLEAYSSFLGAEGRLHFATMRGKTTPELWLEIAEVSEGLARVRLIGAADVYEKATILWSAATDLLQTSQDSRQLPTAADSKEAMAPKLSAHAKASHMLEEAMRLELEGTLREFERIESLRVSRLPSV